MSERRLNERFPLQLRVDLRRADGEQSSHQAVTEDICSTGFYVTDAPPTLQEGSRVEVALWLPVGPEGKYAGLCGLGRVVRVDRGPEGQVGLAVRFDRVNFSPGEVRTLTKH